MHLNEIIDLVGANIVLTRYAKRHEHKWTAEIPYARIMHGIGEDFGLAEGHGETPLAATTQLVKLMNGKRVMFFETSVSKTPLATINIPKNLMFSSEQNSY